MKKQLLLILTLSFLLALAACGTSGGGEEPEAGGTPMEKNPDYVDITAADAPIPQSDETDTEHTHTLSTTDHTVEHEPVGYCGNTVTTISCGTSFGGESWEKSFDDDDSVVLTDLLRYLDYSDPICRCPSEYNVDTEFGTGYGINLTEGYARYNGGQVSLTSEQIETIQDIIDRITE